MVNSRHLGSGKGRAKLGKIHVTSRRYVSNNTYYVRTGYIITCQLAIIIRNYYAGTGRRHFNTGNVRNAITGKICFKVAANRIGIIYAAPFGFKAATYAQMLPEIWHLAIAICPGYTIACLCRVSNNAGIFNHAVAVAGRAKQCCITRNIAEFCLEVAHTRIKLPILPGKGCNLGTVNKAETN